MPAAKNIFTAPIFVLLTITLFIFLSQLALAFVQMPDDKSISDFLASISSPSVTGYATASQSSQSSATVLIPDTSDYVSVGQWLYILGPNNALPTINNPSTSSPVANLLPIQRGGAGTVITQPSPPVANLLPIQRGGAGTIIGQPDQTGSLQRSGTLTAQEIGSKGVVIDADGKIRLVEKDSAGRAISTTDLGVISKIDPTTGLRITTRVSSDATGVTLRAVDERGGLVSSQRITTALTKSEQEITSLIEKARVVGMEADIRAALANRNSMRSVELLRNPAISAILNNPTITNEGVVQENINDQITKIEQSDAAIKVTIKNQNNQLEDISLPKQEAHISVIGLKETISRTLVQLPENKIGLVEIKRDGNGNVMSSTLTELYAALDLTSQIPSEETEETTTTTTTAATTTATNVLKITCDSCQVEKTCTCRFSGTCTDGTWMIKNKGLSRAIESFSKQLSEAKEIILTPVAGGEVDVALVCSQPSQKTGAATVEVKSLSSLVSISNFGCRATNAVWKCGMTCTNGLSSDMAIVYYFAKEGKKSATSTTQVPTGTSVAYGSFYCTGGSGDYKVSWTVFRASDVKFENPIMSSDRQLSITCY